MPRRLPDRRGSVRRPSEQAAELFGTEPAAPLYEILDLGGTGAVGRFRLLVGSSAPWGAGAPSAMSRETKLAVPGLQLGTTRERWKTTLSPATSGPAIGFERQWAPRVFEPLEIREITLDLATVAGFAGQTLLKGSPGAEVPTELLAGVEHSFVASLGYPPRSVLDAELKEVRRARRDLALPEGFWSTLTADDED